MTLSSARKGIKLHSSAPRRFFLLGFGLLLFLNFVPLSYARSSEKILNPRLARLLSLVQTAPNWPYIWLAELESDSLGEKTTPNWADWQGQRFFLKGIAYFYLVPEYSRHRDFNRRLQILEKTLDNWQAAARAFRKEKSTQAKAEAKAIARARENVFQRYLNEKRTRRYQGQTLEEVFGSSGVRPCSEGEESFVMHVLCVLKKAKAVQTK